ncbi:hypothetical protein TPHA_0G01230 [Tetrapisispora phaffii CBS 4417]|uniref:Transcription initiation factor TFIID subunit 9 n=1 Tax=Tetrapisispora phaffii (strain ATCC 24235 / CBS 4417 / NBRC 1672 / NRRL Y-8282 / UCD 70-5) TaxID=1071381 RepID=G8BVN2_TETPH|nr:hypothetical protein TPHA_0G01230 [Tetrapisispora phaffii CBS 4417]CCE63960.1 hypothetical protein TPHA_0G01230 [Tetrapisispora phaffii CBS 4417]
MVENSNVVEDSKNAGAAPDGLPVQNGANTDSGVDAVTGNSSSVTGADVPVKPAKLAKLANSNTTTPSAPAPGAGAGASASANLAATNVVVNTSSQEDIPRDVRLLHLLLASQSIHQYEDQVPLQLMDFAYRYTQEVLKDAIVYNDYAGNNPGNHAMTSDGASSTAATGQSGKNATAQSNANNSKTGLTVEDIRLAIAARTQYQFKPTAPKELLLQLASERNKKPLPQVIGSWGIRLPPEKYCLTAKDWKLDEEKN